MCSQAKCIAIIEVQEAQTAPRRVEWRLGQDCIEHGLEVSWRAGDDAQDLGRGRLLFQRLFRLVEEAHVLDGDHRLRAKVCNRSICCCVNGLSARDTVMQPMATLSRSIGTARTLRTPKHPHDLAGGGRVRIPLDIADVDDRTLHHCPGGDVVATGYHRIQAPDSLMPLFREVVVSDEMEPLAVEPEHRAHERVAQPDGALHDRIEHRLHVRRRARDHAQDLACGGLPLQRLLRLVEQPDVLDGNDRLVGKRLEERNLLGRERMDLGPRVM